MRMHSIENDHFVMALFALGALIYWILRKFRLHIRPRPVKTIPIAMNRLRWAAYRRTLASRSVYVLLALAFAALCHAAGRMGIGASIATLGLLLLYPLIEASFILKLQRSPLKSLPPELISAMEQELSGKVLARANGAWGYCDHRWYICVSSDLCIVLWAGCIDFSMPVRRREQSWTGNGSKAVPFRIRNSQIIFTTRSGDELIGRSQITPMLQEWVKNHRGRFE